MIPLLAHNESREYKGKNNSIKWGRLIVLSKNSKVPLYSQLMDILINEIENEMQENEKILSEREICEKYDLSRATVRQATAELEKEGYIYKKHGKGTFVASKKINQNLQGFYSFTEEMKKRGKVPTTKVLKFEILPLNHEVAKKMHLTHGEIVYKFCRLRLADGESMMVETTYVPYNTFPGITKETLSNNALYDIFRDSFNQKVEYAEEEFLPILTNESEAKNLKIEVGSPSLKINRFAYNKFGKIIEYTVSIARGDKFRYTLKLV